MVVLASNKLLHSLLIVFIILVNVIAFLIDIWFIKEFGFTWKILRNIRIVTILVDLYINRNSWNIRLLPKPVLVKIIIYKKGCREYQSRFLTKWSKKW